MAAFCSAEFRWFELLVRILCDARPALRMMDVIYLYGQTEDNQSSTLARAVRLSKEARRPKVGIPLLGNEAGFPGFEDWKRSLLSGGVAAERIVGVPLAEDLPPSTYSEALGLVRLARENGWERVCVVAPPLHIVSAFISTVSAVQRENYDLAAYSAPTNDVNWQRRVVHSQGVTTGTRKELLRGEFERLHRYHAKGDLVTAEEVLAYLDQRDAQEE